MVISEEIRRVAPSISIALAYRAKRWLAAMKIGISEWRNVSMKIVKSVMASAQRKRHRSRKIIKRG
jgi:hypothetical protein